MCEVASTLLHLLLSPQLWCVLAAQPISKYHLQCRRQQRRKHGGDIKNSICFLGHLSQCCSRLPNASQLSTSWEKQGVILVQQHPAGADPTEQRAVRCCTGTTGFINGTRHRMQVPHTPQATLGFSHCCSHQQELDSMIFVGLFELSSNSVILRSLLFHVQRLQLQGPSCASPTVVVES